MRKIMLALSVLVSALLMCGATVILFKDRTTLVPPPEQVSESFFKQIQLKRYSRAIPYLSSNLERKVTADLMVELRRQVQAKIGVIEKVKGKKGTIRGNSAVALTEIKGKEGFIEIPVKLLRQQGVWKVDSVRLNLH